MEMKLCNGDYIPNSLNGFKLAMGFEEKLERILYKLSCRKGGFAPMPNLGSELHKLLREKRENRVSSARKYILEALFDEHGIVLTDVRVSEINEGLTVDAEFEYSGLKESVTIKLGDEK